MTGESPIRDYVDPHWQFVANAGWTKGSHNVKFGVDYIILYQDHYETQAQSFAFNGGVTTLTAQRTTSTGSPHFSWGLPSSRTAQVMTPLLGGDASGASHPSTGSPNEFRPNTLRNTNVGTYIRDQWNITPKITASVGVRWDTARCRAARITVSKCTTSPPTGFSSAMWGRTMKIAVSRSRRTSSRHGWAWHIGRRKTSSSVSGIPGTRKAIIRAGSRWCPHSHFHRRLSSPKRRQQRDAWAA